MLGGRQSLAEERARDREAAGAEADSGEITRQLSGDGVVVFTRRIDGRDTHEPLETREEIGGVEVDVGRGSHRAERAHETPEYTKI